jgi:hypothetical protein
MRDHARSSRGSRCLSVSVGMPNPRKAGLVVWGQHSLNGSLVCSRETPFWHQGFLYCLIWIWLLGPGCPGKRPRMQRRAGFLQYGLWTTVFGDTTHYVWSRDQAMTDFTAQPTWSACRWSCHFFVDIVNETKGKSCPGSLFPFLTINKD